MPLEGGLDGYGWTAGRHLGDDCNRLGERAENWNEGANTGKNEEMLSRSRTEA